MGKLIILVAVPLLATSALVFVWPWLGLITLIPALIYAVAVGFVGAARSNPDWGLMTSAFIPLACCFAGWWLGKALRQFVFD